MKTRKKDRKKNMIKRKLVLAFGEFNYNLVEDVYRLSNGQKISPECAEEVGVILRSYDEFGRILKVMNSK